MWKEPPKLFMACVFSLTLLPTQNSLAETKGYTSSTGKVKLIVRRSTMLNIQEKTNIYDDNLEKVIEYCVKSYNPLFNLSLVPALTKESKVPDMERQSYSGKSTDNSMKLSYKFKESFKEKPGCPKGSVGEISINVDDVYKRNRTEKSPYYLLLIANN